MLLYKEEHINCCLYDKAGIVTDIQSFKGEELSFYGCAKILFLLKGKILHNLDRKISILEEKNFVLLPNNNKCIIQVKEDAHILTINLHKKMYFCHIFSIEMLYNLKKGKGLYNTYAYQLKINDVLFGFLNNLIKTTNDGLRCEHFLELKQKEIFFYLRMYYPKQELLYFFSPVLNNDLDFINLIHRNYCPKTNIQELAKKTNYSLSGFKNRFLKVFNVPPYKWLTREKAKSIHYDINISKITFKEIAFKYGFSSQAHFSKFCKNVFNSTPSKMREENINRLIILKK